MHIRFIDDLQMGRIQCCLYFVFDGRFDWASYGGMRKIIFNQSTLKKKNCDHKLHVLKF